MIRRSPYILLVLATCIWGGNFVAGKALVLHIPPITLAALRWGIAFLCLLPFYGKQAWGLRVEFLRNWKMLLFLSATGVAGFNTLTYVAVQFTGSINASLMNSATPIIVVILTWLVIRERFAWSALPGILISMAGVSWIISRGSLSALLHLSFNKGDLLMLIAVLCWGLYSVGMKKVGGRIPSSPLLLAQVAIALVMLIPLSLIEWAVKSPQIAWNSGLVSGLIYIGLFASIVAFLSWNRAIELVGPQRCAGFLNFIPMFSAIFATAFTGESLKLYHLLGAVCIVAGVYLTNYAMKKRQTRAA
ncbi:DMT family transporter [Paenibacillus aceris]|uniref:Drug/metabolite transporter (DMT)-like permease n=1 Tax=Paenibacillus aceris TaxID=869555 RepID=A0ABS4HUC3_9BACL|nr:DMT family transporter [Paenibacillus aceris]MBP1962202.1 drug/metabolite transporter (DMT)-like permease [Paenibacillus aceris]NHW33953.1 DMT family transporter [Paenibacillus aceris]